MTAVGIIVRGNLHTLRLTSSCQLWEDPMTEPDNEDELNPLFGEESLLHDHLERRAIFATLHSF